MSGWTIALIAVGSPLAYCMLAGVVWSLLPFESDDPAKGLGAAFWPVALPAMLGSALVTWIRSRRGDDGELPQARQVRR